jgi:hypothetical protein
MSYLTYLLGGFGYLNGADFRHTVFKLAYSEDKGFWIKLSAGAGTFRLLLFDFTGLDIIVFSAFVFLIVAEFQTGLKVAMRKKKERFQSRKFGRMILKIGVYIMMIGVLHAFSGRFEIPPVFGLEINPFTWLYYVVFILIVFQLIISWLENLSALGYKETKGIIGVILRKMNQWFEFDGSKDNDY